MTKEINQYGPDPTGEESCVDWKLTAETRLAEIERLTAALKDAAYALFQIKRMVPEAIVEHSKQAYEKACAVLDGDAQVTKTRHVIECNYQHGPIGGDGCICVVVNKHAHEPRVCPDWGDHHNFIDEACSCGQSKPLELDPMLCKAMQLLRTIRWTLATNQQYPTTVSAIEEFLDKAHGSQKSPAEPGCSQCGNRHAEKDCPYDARLKNTLKSGVDHD